MKGKLVERKEKRKCKDRANGVGRKKAAKDEGGKGGQGDWQGRGSGARGGGRKGRKGSHGQNHTTSHLALSRIRNRIGPVPSSLACYFSSLLAVSLPE